LPLIFSVKNKPGHIIIKDRHGTIVTNVSNEHGYSLPKNLSAYQNIRYIPIIQDILLIEDKRFYEHWGVDVLAKMRALWSNITLNQIVGGSTLTEQWVKNKYFPQLKRNISQKIREAILAFLFSISESKENILEKYLNTVYL
jgi:membrane peptidoglycan carboxypeptidase